MICPYDQYANVFKTLSDATRLKICSVLCESQEVCGGDLLTEVSVTQPTLSYHMKLLCEIGIANGRKDGAHMRYTLNREALNDLQHFIASMGTDVHRKHPCEEE